MIFLLMIVEFGDPPLLNPLKMETFAQYLLILKEISQIKNFWEVEWKFILHQNDRIQKVNQPPKGFGLKKIVTARTKEKRADRK